MIRAQIFAIVTTAKSYATCAPGQYGPARAREYPADTPSGNRKNKPYS